jgi:hypothetical protein
MAVERRRSGSVLRGVAILLIALVLGGLVAEGAIRALDLFAGARAVAGRELPPDDGEGRLVNLVHPYLGWSRRPGLTSPLAYWRGEIPLFPDGQPTEWAKRNWRSNVLGYFSEIADYTQVDPDHYVVGVFGGSFADQLALLGGAALEAALVERFAELRGKVVVLNLGSSAYKQPQQVISLLEMVVAGVPFDLIVNLDGYNEIHFGYASAQAGHHPVFPSRGPYRTTVGFLAERSAGSDALAERILSEKQSERAWLARIGGGAWLGRSELARSLAGALAQRHQRRRLELESEFQELGVSAELPVASFPHRCEDRAGDCWRTMADVWERSSLLMHGIARDIGAEYLHVLQPNQYVEGSKPLSDEERRHAWQPGPRQTLVQRGYAILRERGARLRVAGVPFHDLTGLYAARTETIYRDVCCHMNLHGNELLAEAIATASLGPSP